MNGSLPLPLPLGRNFMVFGGPYRKRPLNTFGVKMAVEINEPCEVNVPVRDFSVPGYEQALDGLRKTLRAVTVGEAVYVGCMGGIGRTGLMMALLAKAWGINDPVAYVRQHYIPHAVETNDQQKFIKDFVIPSDIQWMVRMSKFWSLFAFGKTCLTEDVDQFLALCPR